MNDIFVVKLSNSDKIYIIDIEDKDIALKYNWCLHPRNYAITYIFYLHRLIMKCPINKQIDHINGNRLDNRKCNLRICSHRENMRNYSKNRSNFTSKYKGVYLDKRMNKFCCSITTKKGRFYLGKFKTEEEAALIYNMHAKIAFGEFVFLNKVE